MAEEIVQFVPFASFVSPSFWHKLAELKIDVDRLEDVARQVHGYFSNTAEIGAGKSLLEVDYAAFNKDSLEPDNYWKSRGAIYNKNTIEEFRGCDKNALMRTEGEKIADAIKSGDWVHDPSLLTRFLVLSYADLKTFDFYYCFGFPAPLYNNSHMTVNGAPFDLNALLEATKETTLNEPFSVFLRDPESSRWTCQSLSKCINAKDRAGNFRDIDLSNIYFAFMDPSASSQPGWPLRVFLAALLHSCPHLIDTTINVIALRSTRRTPFSESKVFRIHLPQSFDIDEVQWLGWELNSKGKFAPKVAAMSDSMDPVKLAESSTNLNLKLMKWRLLPELNLESIAGQKCLLFGAGTLGCGVARNLLSWGVKHITLVDSGRVSYSNPVRQNLYRHEDALNKRPKAVTAAERLLEICPGADIKGVSVHIPMPGHNVSDSMRAECVEQFQVIDSLVKEHDVLFLLTDSRESRWLPTVLGGAYGKVVMNSALGFESYLVMRHGTRGEPDKTEPKEVEGFKCISGGNLGCYFCNDIVAPGNSMKDRTLDQQCTVTRPAVSNIAASLVVELFIALTQHKDGGHAPAYIRSPRMTTGDIPEGLLGVIPHSIRGNLTMFEQIIPATERFSKCIACSEIVLDSFRRDGFELALKAFNSSRFLEDLTGITELLRDQQDVVECDEDDFELSD